ncbi:MAG: transposase, partial [Lachnospiraceae bacterium]|nr:transposase [Lachnospiraceae bacterium]
GAAYKSETLDEELKERYPVVTLVLYFGEKRWKRFSLYDCLGDIPEYLKPYVSDYKINVFEIAYLTDEQVKKFKSDFKFVADYFVQMRKNKNYIAPVDVIKHVDEVLKLMQVLTKDTEWGNNGIVKMKGEPYMDHFLSNRIAEARTNGKVETYLEFGLSVSEIAEKLDMKEEEVSKIIEKLETENLQKQN